jgi:hypothetical protein
MFCYGFQVFLGVFFSNVLSVFFYILQVLYLDVSKVDPVLHMLLWLYTHVSSVSSVSDIYYKCFIWMFQKKISGTRKHILLPVRCRRLPSRRRSPHTPAGGGGGGAVCMRACEICLTMD